MEDDAARRTKAHEIYDTFIPDSADTQINIKDKNRKFIDAALGDTSGLLDANIFEVRRRPAPRAAGAAWPRGLCAAAARSAVLTRRHSLSLSLARFCSLSLASPDRPHHANRARARKSTS